MFVCLRAAGPPGIRAQLSILYTAVFALLIVLFGTVFYLTLRQALESGLDTALHLRTQQIASGISFENSHITVRDLTGSLPDLAAPGANGQPGTSTANQASQDLPGGEDAVQSTIKFGSLVRILDTSGHPFYVSPGFRTLVVPPASVRDALQGKSWLGSLSARGGQTVRLFSAGLVDNGQVFGVVQVGEPLGPTTATLRAAAIGLFLLAPFALVLAALASYWLAARAFRPVASLTRMAREIEAEDLHRRVPVAGARDEIRELALTLNEMIERLERAFAQQRRFVADASHELRTPVATILSLADTDSLQGGTTQDYSDAVQSISAEAERLSHFITDLLALARADEGYTTLDAVPVRLDLLATEVMTEFGARAIERGVQLVLEAPAPVMVLGDEARLIQVAMNLVDNALTYTDPGGRVDLCVGVDNEWARLAVRDTGSGIAPEHLPHIFERFYRANPARTAGDGHSGLGLSIVEWAVRAHQGSIAVDSQPGSGTSVTVRLPLAQPETNQTSAAR